MKSDSALERYFTSHAKLKERDKSAKQRSRPFLTISRETGAGGHTVGQKVIEILNRQPRKAPWTLFDKELVDVVIEQHDLPRKVAEYMTESKVSAFEELVADLLGIQPGSDTLIRKTNETMIALAQMGNCVLIGRGGNFATRRLESGLHVRLLASPETRLRRVREYYGVDEREAEELMKKTDADRREYVRAAFGNDVADSLAYDCVINTTWMDCDDAAHLLAEHLQRL